jgi:hypothetical protein
MQKLARDLVSQIHAATEPFVLVVDVSAMRDFPSVAFVTDVVAVFRGNEGVLTPNFLGTVWRLPSSEAVPFLRGLVSTLYEIKRPILFCGPGAVEEEHAFTRELAEQASRLDISETSSGTCTLAL